MNPRTKTHRLTSESTPSVRASDAKMVPEPAPVPKPKKQIQLNFFETACTSSVNAIGQWKCVSQSPSFFHTSHHLTNPRDPTDISRTKDTLDYYVWLAKIAERGLITSIFFTDLYGGAEVYGGSKDTPFSAGSQVGRLDPVTVISAMAVSSENVGFGVTGSISYIREPFHKAWFGTMVGLRWDWNWDWDWKRWPESVC